MRYFVIVQQFYVVKNDLAELYLIFHAYNWFLFELTHGIIVVFLHI